MVYWLRGSTLNPRIHASIRANAAMAQLTDRIRDEQLDQRNVANKHICLYRVLGDENEVRESLIKMGDGKPLQEGNLLPNFLGVPVLNPPSTLLPRLPTVLVG